MAKPTAVFLSPEAPYPPVGGGAMRSAALLEYVRRRFQVDLITFAPDVPDSLYIELPRHSRSKAAKTWRNLRRYALGRPPLLDRYSGFGDRLAALLTRQNYDLAVVEHFWCAPYAEILNPRARRLVLDLHNIESELADTVAASERWPVSAMFRRFASAYRRLESAWLPEFDAVLTTSEDDAVRVRAEVVPAVVYPNTVAFRKVPDVARENAVVFTGNLEYHPNVSAVRWFAREIWPAIHAEAPHLEWRLVGRNPEAIAAVSAVPGVRVVGPVEDAIAEIARARVAVAPLLAGSGTRLKILEAWCACTPVVSTTIGAAGLGATSGRDILIADEPGVFAKAVLRACGANEIAAAARRRYEREFTHEAGWRKLDESGVFSL